MKLKHHQRFYFYLVVLILFSLLIYLLGILRSMNLKRNSNSPDLQESRKINNFSANEVLIKPVVAFPQLVFELPVGVESPPDGSNRLFVVQQKGIISVFSNSVDVKEASIFLDIRDRVFSGHSEEGLLGLAFHPNFKNNGYFFVYHTANPPRRSVVSRYQVFAHDPNQADPNSENIILEVAQPYGNHNGGQITFGPDGNFYIALGDGGSGGDPHGHGQNRKTLLGSILRIDVDHPTDGENYGIPRDNPFRGNKQGFKEEIYAYGLRNPWRFSFDPETKWLWAADVGQDKPIEEIDIIKKGGNYGWNIMEGSHCYQPPLGCNKRGLELPIWEYTKEDGRCITGGFVYRGKKIPYLYGRYVYADFLSGRIWALNYNGKNPPQNELINHDPNLYISSFGVDQDREFYFCSFDGRIYKFVRI